MAGDGERKRYQGTRLDSSKLWQFETYWSLLCSSGPGFGSRGKTEPWRRVMKGQACS